MALRLSDFARDLFKIPPNPDDSSLDKNRPARSSVFRLILMEVLAQSRKAAKFWISGLKKIFSTCMALRLSDFARDLFKIPPNPDDSSLDKNRPARSSVFRLILMEVLAQSRKAAKFWISGLKKIFSTCMALRLSDFARDLFKIPPNHSPPSRSPPSSGLLQSSATAPASSPKAGYRSGFACGAQD